MNVPEEEEEMSFDKMKSEQLSLCSQFLNICLG